MFKCTSKKEKGPQNVMSLFGVSLIRDSTVQFESGVRSHGEQKLKGKVEDDVVDELEVGGSVRE